MSQFTALLNDLAAQSNHRAAPQPVRRTPVASPWPLLSTRPDPGLRKALDEVSELRAESVLGGMRPGMGVTVKGQPGVFCIIDMDAAAGRVHVRQVRDHADDPAGVNFIEPTGWVDAGLLVLAPEFNAPGAEGGSFAGVLEATTALRAGEAKIADIKARAAALLKRKRADLSVALRDGRISGMDAIQNEILLNAFASKMGL